MASQRTIPGASARPELTKLSVRARLLLLALLVLLLPMLDRVRLVEATRTARIEAAHTKAVDILRSGVDAQSQIVEATRAVMQVAARNYMALMRAGGDCVDLLTGFKTSVPWLLGISVTGTQGRITCSTRVNAVGIDVSDRPYFASARDSLSFILGDYIINRASREPTIIAAQPIRGATGSMEAMLLASVDLRWISRLAKEMSDRAHATVFVIDSKGTVIAGSTGLGEVIGSNFAGNALIGEILGKARGTMVAESVDHVRRITAFASLPGTQARLVVGLDESEVLRDIGRETNIAYLQLALIALVILFGAWFGGERLIVEPIRELARMSTRIGRGEAGLGPRRRAWAAEFAPLAAALDDMAGKLAKRENDLRSANRHLEELASIDSLSGLANRRSFDARLEAEWRRARVTGEPVSLLMIDVDHFKLFNDTYGHLSGDHCLRLVGETIMAAAGRSSDFAARYGGEEFTLLLPGAPADKAIDIAEALRCAIVERNITNAAAPAKLVTVSIGVGSLYPAGDDNAQTLIEAADAGLYNAKRRGRNAVVVHGQVEILQAG